MSDIFLKNLPPEIYRHIFHFLNPISKPILSVSLLNLNWCTQCGEYLQEHYLNSSKSDYICLKCYNFNEQLYYSVSN